MSKAVSCPYCNVVQKLHWCAKKWKYNNADVQRFECSCGKNFNFYDLGSTFWTIPKKIEKPISHVANIR